MSVLDMSNLTFLNPLEHRKVGAIIQNMQGAEYNDEQINDVCRALFLDQSSDDMAKAWKVFAGENKTMAIAEFRDILPLIGEMMLPKQERDALCEMADEEYKGILHVEEFTLLMQALNPKESGSMWGF